jgi:hypothetical protein
MLYAMSCRVAGSNSKQELILRNDLLTSVTFVVFISHISPTETVKRKGELWIDGRGTRASEVRPFLS